jgi:hypothetical protein
MARNRTISPDFWTWEAVVDCRPLTRLLFLGLWNFADDYGVQPLRPRTIRMQVFPGDELDADRVRAMIEELAARKLVRIYAVDGVDYLAIVDWQQIQRVSRRAKRRFPPDPETMPAAAPATPPSPLAAEPSEPVPPEPAPTGEPQRWRERITSMLRQYVPHDARLDQIEEQVAHHWASRWIAEGCDYGNDILPAVRDFSGEGGFRAAQVDWRWLDRIVMHYRRSRRGRDQARTAA